VHHDPTASKFVSTHFNHDKKKETHPVESHKLSSTSNRRTNESKYNCLRYFDKENNDRLDTNFKVRHTHKDAKKLSKQEQLEQAYAWTPDVVYEQLPDPEEDDQSVPELEEVSTRTEDSGRMDLVSVEDVESEEEAKEIKKRIT
jgi:hypothetical protein